MQQMIGTIAAAKAAGCNAPFYAVAFPLRHGRRFGKEIKPILSRLPKADAIREERAELSRGAVFRPDGN
jgi:hypothetical protein